MDSGLAETLRPQTSTAQPLLRSLVAQAQGATAAPLVIGKTLAEGGMGVVKLARQEALGRTVVVKTLRGDHAKSAAESVLREAWATGALEHPNIVPVHDIRLDESGAPVIVLQRIEGETWADLMHDQDAVEKRFGETDLLSWNLEILRSVCQALRYAHSRAILHRDIKPANVMIGAFGEVYLVDWGIALSLGNDESTPLPLAKNSSSMAGTPCYMAPEMLGDAPLDERTDIYLLGAVLVEILTGEPPHSTTSLKLMLADVRASTPRLPETAPESLREICIRAMAALPDNRYATVDEFLDAIVTFLRNRSSQNLANEAERTLVQLEKTLRTADIDRQFVYRQFGALRFGFARALDAWPENPNAFAGANRARVAMAQYELAEGHPSAAAGILEEVDDVPDALQSQLTEALVQQEAEQNELNKFRDAASISIGRRTRVFLAIIIGSLWTSAPLLEHFTNWGPWRGSRQNMMVSSLAVWAIACALWFWGRESLLKTELNRKLSIGIFFIFPLQILLYAGSIGMDLPVQSTEQILVFLWAVIATYTTILVERRLAPVAVSFIAAFILSVAYPAQRYLFMAAGTCMCVATVVAVWAYLPTRAAKASSD